MRKWMTILFFMLAHSYSFAQLTQYQIDTVQSFINNVKSLNKEKIAMHIDYPLRRHYPLPSVKNESEFLERFNEIFDAELIKIISDSKPADWEEIGWRGITFSHGLVWLDDAGDITVITYESELEKQKREGLIKNEKDFIYPTLKNFQRPLYILETINYRVRIDELEGGKLRYAAWSIKKKMNEKPEIVLEHGDVISEGSGGNCRYEFKNDHYLYSCSIIRVGAEDSPPAKLVVYKNGKEILNEDCVIVGQ